MNAQTPIGKAEIYEESGAEPTSWRPITLTVACIAVIGSGLYFLMHRPQQVAAAPPLPVVAVATPLSRKVSEWDDYVGRFEASRSVEVRPRVSGQITAVRFSDGAMVRQGQLLFTIDQRPYAAALAEAKAGLAGARSDLALARADLARANRLMGDEAISRSEVDRLRARVQAAAAAVAAGEARVSTRALELDFTNVRAPIAGRVSDRRVDPGNLVVAGEGGSGSLLTTVNALDPIYFAFDASEALFLKTKRDRQTRTAASPVEIRLQDEATYKWRGRLDFTDNGLNPRSGTIRARAVLPNSDLFLTPGMFGNMRLASGGLTSALLVPDTTVQTDQVRKTVLVVGSDGVVAAKPVVLGPVVDGLRIVRSGLSPNDRVVISGIQSAAPGAKVRTKPGRIVPVQAPQQTEAPMGGGEATFAS